MCVCEGALGETVLMFRLQMRETSNPKHGCVLEMHASAHCQPIRMLTNDAPDSSPLLSPFFLSVPPPQSLSDPERTPPPTSTAPSISSQNMGGEITETQSDYSQRTVIEYVTNTLRIALGNQIKK